jgi:hypothetical protein
MAVMGEGREAAGWMDMGEERLRAPEISGLAAALRLISSD